jgi:hypothetical protein
MIFKKKNPILLDFVKYFCRINLFLYIVRCPHEGCDKVFISPLSMGSHPRVHLHNKEDFTCKFEGCGRVFDKKCRLNQHMRSHTGEKPYICYYQVSMTTMIFFSYLSDFSHFHMTAKWCIILYSEHFLRLKLFISCSIFYSINLIIVA